MRLHTPMFSSISVTFLLHLVMNTNLVFCSTSSKNIWSSWVMTGGLSEFPNLRSMALQNTSTSDQLYLRLLSHETTYCRKRGWESFSCAFLSTFQFSSWNKRRPSCWNIALMLEGRRMIEKSTYNLLLSPQWQGRKLYKVHGIRSQQVTNPTMLLHHSKVQRQDKSGVTS